MFLPWGHIGATWHIQLNLCFLRPTSVRNPIGKSFDSVIFHSSWQNVVRYVRASFPNNCPFTWGSVPLLMCGSSCPPRHSIPNGISIGSAVFAQLKAESPCTLQWVPLSPKLPLSVGRSRPHLIPDSLGLFKPTTQNGISIGSAVFAQFTTECLSNLQWNAPSPLKIPLSIGVILTLI